MTKTRRRAGGKVPVLPVVAVVAAVGEALMAGNKHYGGTAPMTLLTSGRWKEGVGAFVSNWAQPEPYLAMAIPLAIDVVLRVVHVNPSLGKKATLA